MLNQLMRYVPLSGLVKKEKCGRILEVGGGAKGISAYLPDTEVVCIDPSFAALPAEENKKVTRIKGSVLNLPFEDDSFPVIVCSDVLEHIEAGDRERAILELWRVGSGKIFLSFPVKETYGKWERRLLKFYKLRGKESPGWLAEHLEMGLPEEKIVTEFLKESRIPFEVVPNENNFIHFAVMILDSSFLSGHLNYLSEIVSPDAWDRHNHPFKANLLRTLFLPFRQLPMFMNFGSTVRKIFILNKTGPDHVTAGENIADYYNRNPGMISSPFGGIKCLPGTEHPYFTETLNSLGVDLRGKAVLDVGCGSGWFARYCKGIVKTYSGVDISTTSVELSRKITPDIVQADSQDLPHKAGSFDYVFCIDSFEHVPDQELAAREFYRVLNEKGRLFLSVPNYSNVAGIVKKLEEASGLYKKDSWAPFDNWKAQALEQFMTPSPVRGIFVKSGFRKFTVIGGKNDLIDGIFPWIDHRFMPYPYNVRELFMRIQKPLERFHWLSLHNFWLIEK